MKFLETCWWMLVSNIVIFYIILFRKRYHLQFVHSLQEYDKHKNLRPFIGVRRETWIQFEHILISYRFKQGFRKEECAILRMRQEEIRKENQNNLGKLSQIREENLVITKIRFQEMMKNSVQNNILTSPHFSFETSSFTGVRAAQTSAFSFSL